MQKTKESKIIPNSFPPPFCLWVGFVFRLLPSFLTDVAFMDSKKEKIKFRRGFPLTKKKKKLNAIIFFGEFAFENLWALGCSLRNIEERKKLLVVQFFWFVLDFINSLSIVVQYKFSLRSDFFQKSVFLSERLFFFLSPFFFPPHLSYLQRISLKFTGIKKIHIFLNVVCRRNDLEQQQQRASSSSADNERVLSSPTQHVSGGGRNVANHLRHSRDTSLTELPLLRTSTSMRSQYNSDDLSATQAKSDHRHHHPLRWTMT